MIETPALPGLKIICIVPSTLRTLILVLAASTGAQSLKTGPPDTCAQRVALSPDAGLIVTAGTPQHPITAFVTATGAVAWRADMRNWPIEAMAFSPTSEYVMIGYSNSFEALAATSGQPLSTAVTEVSHGVGDVAFSRDGSLFAVLNQLDQIRVYATPDWKEVGFIEDTGYNGLTLSPEGAYVAAGSYSSEAKIWEVQSKKLTRTIHVKGGNRPGIFMNSAEQQTHHWNPVWKVEFSPDGKRLATATDGYIQLWDVATGMEVATLKSGGTARTLAFSSDGKRIGWATRKGELRTWDSGTHRLVKVKILTTVGEIAFSPDLSRAYVPDLGKINQSNRTSVRQAGFGFPLFDSMKCDSRVWSVKTVASPTRSSREIAGSGQKQYLFFSGLRIPSCPLW